MTIRQDNDDVAVAKRILLVERNKIVRNMHTLALNTHGYDVQSTSSDTEVHRLCESFRPDLVLVAFTTPLERIWELCEHIQLRNSRQRIAFLHDDTLHLCPLFLDGELIRKAEGADDYLQRVEALLATDDISAAAPAP